MGSERVKGSATKTIIGSGVAHPRHSPLTRNRNFSVKVVARILRRILVTLYNNYYIYNYTYTKISMRVVFDSLARSQ